MYRRYDDILSRIAEEPTWFDEHAVPRYCEFAPDQIANIYATEAALAEVSCQGCQRVYRVAFSDQDFPAGTIADRIRSRTLRFGDPPNACDDSCMSGASMSSESRKVVEYWKRHDPKYTRHDETLGCRVVTDMDAFGKWVRDPALETDISPD